MKFKDILAALKGNDGGDDLAKVDAEILKETKGLDKVQARRNELDAAQVTALLDRDFAGYDRAEADRHKLDLEERGAMERIPLLEERRRRVLQIQRDEAIIARKSEYVATYRAVRAAVTALGEANASAISFYERVQMEFGADLARRQFPHIHYAGIPLPDLVPLWVENMDRGILMTDSGPVMTETGPARRLATPGTTGTTVRDERRYADRALPPTVVLSEGNQTPAPQAKRSLKAETAKRDEVLIVLTRSGVEYTEGELSIAGDRVSVSPKQAAALIANGAAESASVIT